MIRRARLCSAAILAAGLVLLSLAVPRLISGVALLPGDEILRRVLEHRPVSAAELDRLADTRRRALEATDRGRVASDLALALLLQAERRRILFADRDLAPVADALSEALAAAPANPHAWMRLALVERMRQSPPSRAAELLEMSILTGPGEREILFPRLQLGLAVWGDADRPLRDLLTVQLDWAWRADRRRTALVAGAAGRLDVLRAFVADAYPEDAAALERAIGTLPRRPAPRS